MGKAMRMTTGTTIGTMSRSRGCSRRWLRPRMALPTKTQATSSAARVAEAPPTANQRYSNETPW